MTLLPHFLLLLVVSTNSEEGRRDLSRGLLASKTQFLFYTHIEIMLGQSHGDYNRTCCGATLIDESCILTAAHCFPRDPEILAGLAQNRKIKVYAHTNEQYDPDAYINWVEEVIFHPDFHEEDVPHPEHVQHDLALAHLSHPYILGERTEIAHLPDDDGAERCKVGTVMGLAYQGIPNTPHKKFVLYSRSTCYDTDAFLDIDPSLVNEAIFFTQPMWNVGYDLKYDSGGPFICYVDEEPYIFGVLSRNKYSHALYEDVRKNLEFISENLIKVTRRAKKQSKRSKKAKKPKSNKGKSCTTRASASILVLLYILVFNSLKLKFLVMM